MAQQKAAAKSARKGATFSAEERAAMKERARELKAEAAKADGEAALLAQVAEMKGSIAHGQAAPRDRQETAPTPHAEDVVRDARVRQREGKVVCFFQSAGKFNSRYATFGFSDEANLDKGHVADVLRAREADRGRGEADRRAREESRELSS
jgi:uncharacterized protein YdhG (YjbR/CyaY superfamily)